LPSLILNNAGAGCSCVDTCAYSVTLRFLAGRGRCPSPRQVCRCLDGGEDGPTVHCRRLHLLVEADEPLVGQRLRVEDGIDVAEHLAVDVSGVAVQLPHTGDLDGVAVVEGCVVDVLAEHLLAERGVALGVEDVEVPERIDGVRHGVLVLRVEQSDRVVLLERQDALVEEVVARGLAELDHLLGDLAPDDGEVLGVDPGHSLRGTVRGRA